MANPWLEVPLADYEGHVMPPGRVVWPVRPKGLN